MLVAADVGGTKTDVAIFSRDGGPHVPIAKARVHTASYPSLQAIVKEFLAKQNKSVNGACFAVAGPVIEGAVKTTNLPWTIEEATIAKELNLSFPSVHLINDLEAIARAVPTLRPSDVQTLNSGDPVSKGAIGVIAPGTGLGESFLTWDGTRYVAHSSEGGHSDFAPTDKRQLRLLDYLLQSFGHVSYERVCSGIGLPHIYRYLRDVEHLNEQPEVAKLIDAADDPSFVIINHGVGVASRSRLCAETIEIFVSILASEASNLALKVLSMGGLYLAGGVVVHTLAALQPSRFMAQFKKKGRLSGLMARIPVHVVMSQAALTGAAACGFDQLQ
ncbi:MAG TPA: glucokinase [Terriglobales bacterium]|nr:glucokinase [Terriglobales bacterium]